MSPKSGTRGEGGGKGAALTLGWIGARVTSSPHALASHKMVVEPPGC